MVLRVLIQASSNLSREFLSLALLSTMVIIRSSGRILWSKKWWATGWRRSWMRMSFRCSYNLLLILRPVWPTYCSLQKGHVIT